jgi:sulfate adenylyltransferase
LKGFTVFFTGLCGAGKSTIAAALKDRLVAEDKRSVTLLDGDVVRRSLSAELGFSKADRDSNIQRVALVAAEVTRHGGICICASIAPYDRARKEARAAVEKAGGFLLVHVSTPLHVCEARDPKGLYARARAGLLPHFTGVSDPYEEPADADLRVDTSLATTSDVVSQLLEQLRVRRWL